MALNFEVASSISFQGFPKRSLCNGEIGDSSGGANAICSRPEVADDIISGEVVDFPGLSLGKFAGC